MRKLVSRLRGLLTFNMSQDGYLAVWLPGVFLGLAGARCSGSRAPPRGLFWVPGPMFDAPVIENRSSRLRARHTFAFRADALERLGALFPYLGSVPELDVGFP